MDFKEFFEKTSPEEFQKVAETAQDDLVKKVIEGLMPLFNKYAEYTVELIKTAVAGDDTETPNPGPQEGTTEVVSAIPDNPGNIPGTTLGKDNSGVVGSETPEGLKATDVQYAVAEAVEAGQADKIMPFVKAVASAHPDAVNEIIKIVKVSLHDAIMNRKIDPEQAAKVAEELDQLIAAPVAAEGGE
jgi:hypothetical protein